MDDTDELKLGNEFFKSSILRYSFELFIGISSAGFVSNDFLDTKAASFGVLFLISFVS